MTLADFITAATAWTLASLLGLLIIKEPQMDPVKQAMLQSAARNGVWLIGAVFGLLGHHIADETLKTLSEAGGAVLVGLAVTWSQWNAYRTEQKALAREVIAVNVGIKKADATPGPTSLVMPADVPTVIKQIAPTLPLELAEPPVIKVPTTEGDSS